jgi:RNA polymerase sigma-70 factor (ECF subfamily)
MLEERDTAVLALEPQQEWTGPVGEAVGRLSEQDREVLILRHVGELSFQEIAKALGLGLSATKMRLYRAEERFRLEYDQAARSRAV